MRKTMHKVFFAWNFDKEEKWLCEMAAKGLALVSVGLCSYTFEESLPGEYSVRMELLDNLPSHSESDRYLRFLEETGVEYIGSVIRWVYVRKKTADGPFDLFSDSASRISHLNRMLTLFGIVGCAQLPIVASNLFLGLTNGLSSNFIVGLFCLSASLLLAYGFFRIWLKKRKLRKEQRLFE